MKKIMSKYGKVALVALFGLCVFLFWYCGYPQALCYHEQNQLFLWTADYFLHDLIVAGGLADYLSEFLVQFYYVPWLGALLLACLFMAFLSLTYLVIQSFTGKTLRWYWMPVSLLPSLWLLMVMGDPEVLLSFPVALTLALLAVWLMNKGCKKWESRFLLLELLTVPALFWLLGGAVTWLYVLTRIAFCCKHYRKLSPVFLSIPYLLAVQLICYNTFLIQYPLESVMIGINYYRGPQEFPGKNYGYDKDLYRLLKMNMLVRQGKWNDIVHEAEQYQITTAFYSNCVNLALAKTRQLADRQFSFYQSGENALLAPRSRDNMTMYPTMEAFWNLGMVNSSLRYATDLQASILNAKVSGRLMRRITECQMVNGKYAVARKNIDLLKQSLFYHDWAVKAEAMLGDDVAISRDSELGRARRMRFKKDMIYSYPEIEKMLGLLFINNPDNKMALDYFMGQMLLKGDFQGFMQYGASWVQRYGGYMQMPVGYQDAVRCIQNRGNVPGSPYAAYAKRMMTQQQEGGRR